MNKYGRNIQWKNEKQAKIQKRTEEKRILPWELVFYGINGAN